MIERARKTGGIVTDRSDIASFNYVIRVDRLRPGDVLLTRSLDKHTSFIAPGTGGLYSHAALWLPRLGAEPPYAEPFDLQMFESEDLGVGETHLAEAFVTTSDGRRFLARLVPDALAIGLFRHPEIGALDPAELGAAARRLRESDEHLGYSELDRLALAVDGAPVLRRRLAAVLRTRDDRDIALVPGAFCSELVAKYFAELRLLLFDDPRPPEEVSPSHLAESRLQEVPDVIIPSGSVVRLEPLRQSGLSSALPAFVRYRSMKIQIERQASILTSTLRRMQERTVAWQSQQLAEQAREALTGAKDADRLGFRRMSRRLSITAESQILALALLREIQHGEKGRAAEDDTDWAIAEAKLRMLVARMVQSGGLRLSRQTALLDRAIALRGRDRSKRSDTEQTRRSGIARWRSVRDLERLLRPVSAAAESAIFDSDRAAEIFDDVIGATFGGLVSSGPPSAD
jgi:hypothetical protein